MAVTDQLALDDKARHESALTLPAPLNSAASVPLAFAVGWQMTELFALTTRGSTSRAASAAHRLEGLPGLIAMDAAGQWDLLVQQVRTKVGHLTDAYLRTGMNVSKLQSFDKEMEALVGHPPAAALPRGNGAVASDPAVGALVEASACVRIALATAHSRLGRAYALGVGLAEICRQRGKATESAADFERRFLSGTRSAQDALADLASSFPAHTSRAVSLSLAQWMEWAQDPRLSGERVRWPNEAVALALGRQGEVWRSLLCGEKLAKDMLSAGGYLRASRCLLARSVRAVPRRLWALLLIGAILVGLGIYFLITAPSAGKAISGVVLSILGTFGITAASLRRTVAGVGDQIGAHVLEAELDLAIGEAITVPPGDWGVTLNMVDVPARGQDPSVTVNARRLHLLRSAVHTRVRSIEKVREFLDAECTMTDKTQQGDAATPMHQTGAEVARWLVRESGLAREQLGLIAGDGGKIVSYEDEPGMRFLVWSFRQGRVCEVVVVGEKHTAWQLAGVTVDGG